MTPDEFRACLREIGWNPRYFAARIGVTQWTVRRVAGDYDKSDAKPPRNPLTPEQENNLRQLAEIARQMFPLPDSQPERP